MLNYYRSVRRRTASFLNGYLMPRLGVRLERVHPKRFRYQQAGSRDGYTHLQLALPEERLEADVYLREGTSDWFTFKQIFLDEDYDLRPLSRYGELKALYASIAARGTPLVVDLGANIGMSALYFSLIFPKARVVAVEPDEGNFNLLSRNLATRPNFEPILAGISSRPTRLSVTNRAAGENAFRTQPADGEAPFGAVQGITVPEIIDGHGGPGGSEPFILKIDVEGAEAELFSSNVEWIDRFPLIVIELHDWLYPGQGTSSNFLKSISQLDRDFVHIGENVFSIRNARGAAH